MGPTSQNMPWTWKPRHGIWPPEILSHNGEVHRSYTYVLLSRKKGAQEVLYTYHLYYLSYYTVDMSRKESKKITINTLTADFILLDFLPGATATFVKNTHLFNYHLAYFL